MRRLEVALGVQGLHPGMAVSFVQFRAAPLYPLGLLAVTCRGRETIIVLFIVLFETNFVYLWGGYVLHRNRGLFIVTLLVPGAR